MIARRQRMGLAAVTVAAATACGGGSAGAPTAKPLHAPANFDPSLEGSIACSRLIVDGTVLSVADGNRPGFMTTRLKVRRWVKPSDGPKTTSIQTGDIAKDGVYQRWKPGTRLFLRVDVDPTALPDWQFTRQQQRQLIRAAAEPIDLECPYGP